MRLTIESFRKAGVCGGGIAWWNTLPRHVRYDARKLLDYVQERDPTHKPNAIWFGLATSEDYLFDVLTMLGHEAAKIVPELEPPQGGIRATNIDSYAATCGYTKTWPGSEMRREIIRVSLMRDLIRNQHVSSPNSFMSTFWIMTRVIACTHVNGTSVEASSAAYGSDPRHGKYLAYENMLVDQAYDLLYKYASDSPQEEAQHGT